MLMTILDQTIVNVALPSIQEDLGFSRSGLAWVVNAYLVAFGGLLLLSGRLGDLAGRRTVLVAGLSVFTAASLLCGVATSPGALVAARFVQGVGGALASAVILGMIVTLFPDPGERARAIGAYSFSAAAGGAIGNLVGGLVTEALDWHWVFLVNVPLGVAWRCSRSARSPPTGASGCAPASTWPAPPRHLGPDGGRGRHRRRGRARLGQRPAPPALGALAVALLAGFVVRQATAATPLLPLRLFRSRTLTGANVVQALMVSGGFAYLFLTALYTQQVLGYGAAQVGAAILPTAIVIGVISLGLSARLVATVGPRRMVLGGLGLMAAGLALLARLPVDGDVRRRRAARGARARRGVRPRHAGAHRPGDDRRDRVRLGRRVGTVLDDPADRRGVRPRVARHAGGRPHRRPPGGRARRAGRAGRGVSPGLRGGGRDRARRARCGRACSSGTRDEPAVEDAQPKQASAVAG